MAKYVSRSGPLRKLIGPANARLIVYLNELQAENIQDRLNALGQEVDRDALLTIQNTIKFQLARFTRKINALDDSHSKWLDLIGKLDEEDALAAELKLYEDASAGRDKFLAILEDAKDAVDVLEAQNREIENRLSALVQTTSRGATSGGTSQHVKLPPIIIEKFGGDVQEFPTFDQCFEATIGSRVGLSDVERLTYLMTLLYGDAAAAVKGYKITGENYKVVLGILKSRFGNATAIKQSLINELKDLPKSGESTSALRRTSEAMERICRQLVELGEDVENQLIAVTLESKLPPSILLDLYRERGTDDPWNASDLRTRLAKLVSMREKVGFTGKETSIESKHDRLSQPNHGSNKNRPREKQQNDVAFAVVNGKSTSKPPPENNNKGCVFCGGPHFNSTCDEYRTQSEKHTRASELRLCFNCLGTGHSLRDCKSERNCRKCSKRHNTALCRQNPSPNDEKARNDTLKGKETGIAQQANQASATKSSSHAVVDSHGNANSNNTATEIIQSAAVSKLDVKEEKVEVLLLSAKVVVMNPEDHRKNAEIMVFFDPGSQRSFVMRSLADQLKLPEIDQETTLTVSTFGQGGHQFTTSKRALSVRLVDGQAFTITANTVDGITKPFRTVPLSPADISELKTQNSAALAMKTTFEKPILMIGIDYFFEFVKRHDAPLASGFHVVHSTVGPMLSGKGILAVAKRAHEEVCSIALIPDETVKGFWSLENIGISDPPAENDDEEAMQQFQESIRKVGDRYMVKLPIKEPNPDLPSNLGLAFGRLKSLCHRLAGDERKMAAYDAVISDQLKQGIIEEVPQDSEATLVHYLPHQPVETPDKTTTKLRVVMDASARMNKSFKSLNDVVYRGPVILPALAGMLLRFRRPRIAIMSDVAKAFLQILLDEPDRDLVRFLWIRDTKKGASKENLVTYRFTRVVFGVNASPFLLAATIRHHLAQYSLPIAQEIDKNIYVDNVLLSADSTAEAIAKFNKSKQIFDEASMLLREFVSNDRPFNEHVASLEKVASTDYVKVLGIGWHIQEDEIEITLPKVSKWATGTTKRTVLSAIAGLFDPLGLVAPVVVEAKAYFQELWSKGYDWDKPIDEPDAIEWNRIIASWTGVRFRIPRRLLNLPVSWDDDTLQFELHCFADASALAYAAVAYIRATDSNGVSTVTLIMSRNRLNPARPITIPRMELLGVVIAVRLIKFIEAELELAAKLSRKAVWTDSSAVLGQIGNEKMQQRFVQNRLNEIRQDKDVEFRHVSGKENPADFSSRGMPPSEFATKASWWSGPSWLRESSDQWPERVDLQRVILSTEAPEDVPEEVSTERMAQVAHADAALTVVDQTSFKKTSLFDLAKFSRLSKHLAVVAHVLRFINKLKPARLRNETEVREYGALTAAEYQQAELLLVKQEQAMFPVDPKSTETTLFLDANGIWRARGRIEESALLNDCIHPIYLPRESRLAILVVMQCHERMMHVGMQQTLAEVRQSYWIFKGRLTVKKILRQNCFVCRRHMAIPFRLPSMPQLPSGRVQRTRPFETVGLDYIGPTTVRMKDQKFKAWVCLITCFSTRGSHLEVVIDMTAISFLNALRRFVARRGRPREILSDNASQFTLVAQTVQLAWNSIFCDETILAYCARERITWRCTTPLAPWTGGLYERLVGLFKKSYKRCIGRKLLDYDQLETTVIEIEAILNSRPLTYVQDDMSSILCPKHLIGAAADLGTPYFPDADDDPTYHPPNVDSREYVLDRWERSIKLGNLYWEGWITDYLLCMRERPQFHHTGPNSQYNFSPREGEVVLLQDEQLQRGQWKLARVTRLRPSVDGTIRSVDVQLPNQKTLRRPINQLYPLEVDGQHRDQPGDGPKEQLTAAAVTKLSEAKTTTKLRLANKLFWVTVSLFLILESAFAGHSCQLNQTLKIIHSQACVSDGLVVMENKGGLKCYIQVHCREGHIKSLKDDQVNEFKTFVGSMNNEFCGEYCPCPDWASGCSHYSGSRTIESAIENDRVKTLIEEQAPEEVCSWEPTIRCDKKFTISRFSQIELYDGTRHVVNSLQLVRSQMSSGDFTCLGQGETVGSPRYCDAHSCKKEGTRFCYYHRSEMVEAVSESEKVPIMAWGTVQKPYYGKKLTDPPKCEQCTFQCVKGGITLQMQTAADKVEICVGQHCQYLSAPRNMESILFPHEISIATHSVRVQVWKGGQRLKNVEKTCPPFPICELIECMLCMEYLANPQCAPRGALMLLVIILYVAGIGIFCCLRSFSWIYQIFRCILRQLWKLVKVALKLPFSLVRWLVSCRSTGMNRPMETIDSDEPRERRTLRESFLRYMPRPAMVKQAMAVVFIICIQGTESCAETAVMTATQSVCETSHEGISTCTYAETTMLSVWPGGQGTCLAMRNERNQVIGKLKLTVEEVKAICNPKTEFFARDASIRVESVKRCGSTGSCHGDLCSNISSQMQLPEFSDKANEAPGHAFCSNSCGCWACGCFYCFPGCLFWKVYAVANSKTIFEKFTCPTWTTRVAVKVSLQLNNDTLLHEAVLVPGQVHRWNHLKLTITALSNPVMPILSTSFITNQRQTVMVNSQEAEAVVRCPTRNHAEDFKCRFSPSLCNCLPTGDTANCRCELADLPGLFAQKDRLLPMETSNVFMKVENNKPSSLIETAAVRLQVTLDQLRLISQIDLNICQVVVKSFGGCYRCRSGAKLEYTCTTNFGSSMALVTCGSSTWMASCESAGLSSTATLLFDVPGVFEQCIVHCPGGESSFSLDGTLAYIGSDLLPDVDQVAVDRRAIIGGGWGFPRFPGFLGMSVFNSLLSVDWSSLLMVAIVIICLISALFIMPYLLPCIFTFMRLKGLLWNARTLVELERKFV